MNTQIMGFRLQRARFKTAYLALAFSVLLPFSFLAANPAELPPEASWRILIEPRFMHPAVSQPIPGAQATLLAAGYSAPESGDDEIHYFQKAEWESLGKPDWALFVQKTQAAASAELTRLTPTLVRDRNQVIECAILHSDRQTTACALLAPEFRKRFADIFGPKLLVAVPDRFTIYVFPSLASRYAEYGSQVLSVYRSSPYRVSLELFELSAQGLRTVGSFEEQNEF